MRGLELGVAQNAGTARNRRWVFFEAKAVWNKETDLSNASKDSKLCIKTLGSLRIPSHGPHTGNPMLEGTADLSHLSISRNRAKLFTSQAEIMLRNHLMLWRWVPQCSGEEPCQGACGELHAFGAGVNGMEKMSTGGQLGATSALS